MPSYISSLPRSESCMVCVENKKRESKQREEGENAERRGRETERIGREGRD